MMPVAFSPSRLFQVLDDLVDDHVGIIRCVQELPREAGSPAFFHFYAEASNTQAFAAQKNFSSSGGASVDRAVAMAKAIGEAVERYCPAIYVREELPLTSFSSASFPCIRPEEFALYSAGQYSAPGFPYVPFTKETPVRWTAGVDLHSCQKWYVPAAMVYMPYFFDEEQGEQPITPRISTGLACHSSYAEAAIAGICEVVERDAFTIVWQSCMSPPKIAIESLSDSNQDLVARFERCGAAVTIFNITLDHGISTIMSVLRSKWAEAPALVFAASSDLSPEQAVRKSLEELAHTRRLALKVKTQNRPFTPTAGYDNVKDQDSHVHLYCDHANLPLADFLFASPIFMNFHEIGNLMTGDPEQDLDRLVSKIRAIGHNVLLADLTTPDVQHVGLRVVRAIIPGFHPFFIGHHLRALGGTRLWEVPQKLGYMGISSESSDNPAPHPYP